MNDDATQRARRIAERCKWYDSLNSLSKNDAKRRFYELQRKCCNRVIDGDDLAEYDFLRAKVKRWQAEDLNFRFNLHMLAGKPMHEEKRP